MVSSPSVSPGKATSSSPSGPQGPSHGPVDYSFRELKSVVDLVFETPVSAVRARKPPLPTDANASDYLEALSQETSSGRGSTSMRICNNNLVSLEGLDRVMPHVLGGPAQLAWLDASCNQLHSIEDVIAFFPNLQVLYLHGNQISNLADVCKLSQLKSLSKLTLHGNPISEHPNYKMYIAAHLPNLRSLDFSTITKVDRDKVDTWFRGYQKQQAARG